MENEKSTKPRLSVCGVSMSAEFDANLS